MNIGFFIESCIKWAKNNYLGHFLTGEGNCYSKTKKNPTAAAYCCTLAAYRSKMHHIGFFIENWFKQTENHYLGYFEIEKGDYYPKYLKNLLLQHIAA